MGVNMNLFNFGRGGGGVEMSSCVSIGFELRIYSKGRMSFNIMYHLLEYMFRQYITLFRLHISPYYYFLLGNKPGIQNAGRIRNRAL